jgi:hypothetical protein
MDSAGNGRRCRIRAMAMGARSRSLRWVVRHRRICHQWLSANLFGADGTSVLIGSWVQLLGVLTAFGAGVIATSANYWHRSVDTEEVRSNIT